MNLVPAWNDAVTVPFIAGETLEECRGLVNVKLNLTDSKYYPSEINAGDELGSLSIEVSDTELCKIPLVADRAVKKSNIFVQLADCLIKK